MFAHVKASLGSFSEAIYVWFCAICIEFGRSSYKSWRNR